MRAAEAACSIQAAVRGLLARRRLRGQQRRQSSHQAIRRQQWLVRQGGGVESFFLSPPRRRAAPPQAAKAAPPRVSRIEIAAPGCQGAEGTEEQVHAEPELLTLCHGIDVLEYWKGGEEASPSRSTLRLSLDDGDEPTFVSHAVTRPGAECSRGGSATTIGLSAITSVVFGPCTKSFRSFGAISAPWRCFSLVTADGTHDFCSVRDRDARTAIVAVQLLKCGGDRRYARLGVLLWQTARLRLKVASRQDGVCCASALARLLVSCTPA